MAIATKHELHDRGDLGFAVYAKGMDGSQAEKAKLLPYVQPGRILELGCGNGAMLVLLKRAFPDSTVVGVDLSSTLLGLCRDRVTDAALVQADIRQLGLVDGSLDTSVMASVLHEVYSYSGYDRTAVKGALETAYGALRPGGRLILRDGVKPAADLVYMQFKNPETEAKFHRFARDFGPYPIHFRRRHGDIQLSREDAMEFLSKYLYDANWAFEVKEQFGVYTLAQYQQEVEAAGFEVLHARSYLIDWLRETHYARDVELYRLKHGKKIPQPFPDSTMILVAEKPLAERDRRHPA